VNRTTAQLVPVPKSSQWKQSCDQLVVLLEGCSEALICNLREFIEIKDNSGAEIIWSSCIACLAYLTVLCEFVGRTEPTEGLAVNAICDSNLEKLGRLTEDIRSEGYTHLDLLLGVRTRKFSPLLLNDDADERTNGLALLGKSFDRL